MFSSNVIGIPVENSKYWVVVFYRYLTVGNIIFPSWVYADVPWYFGMNKEMFICFAWFIYSMSWRQQWGHHHIFPAKILFPPNCVTWLPVDLTWRHDSHFVEILCGFTPKSQPFWIYFISSLIIWNFKEPSRYHKQTKKTRNIGLSFRDYIFVIEVCLTTEKRR